MFTRVLRRRSPALWRPGQRRLRSHRLCVFSSSAFRSSRVSQASGYLHESWIIRSSGHRDADDDLRQCRGDHAEQRQANARVFVDRSRGICAGRFYRSWHGQRLPATRDAAIAAVAFYMLTYAVTNLGAFAIVTLLAQKNDRRAEFEDYNGIGFKAPVLSFYALAVYALAARPAADRRVYGQGARVPARLSRRIIRCLRSRRCGCGRTRRSRPIITCG